MGFCGGAGLALSSPPAFYLTPIRRMPLSERLPSASGEIHVSGALSHPAWQNIPPEILVSVWWPSQFLLESDSEVSCLASYSTPGAGFQVADLRVSDVDESAWGELEKAYGINLDPARIKGHPAIIEVGKGKGRLVLSYAHLETPGDSWGNRLFFNILNYLNDSSAITTHRELPGAQYFHARQGIRYPSSGVLKAKQAAADLIAFGEANLLWNWRKPWLLNWRRGIRGLEYGYSICGALLHGGPGTEIRGRIVKAGTGCLRRKLAGEDQRTGRKNPGVLRSGRTPAFGRKNRHLDRNGQQARESE